MGNDVVAAVRGRSQETPDDLVYTFLVDGTDEGDRITFAELDLRARAVAAVIAQRVGRGERALLVFPPSLDFAVAFLGCLYAGVVAVPAYPPEPARLARTLPRLVGIVRDARPRLLITCNALLPFREMLASSAPELVAIDWLASDQIGSTESSAWTDPGIRDETIAFLQYSSGSTGEPRGVIVSHGNLAANARGMRIALRQTTESVATCWLPSTHDMGLIDGLLQPLFVGFRTYVFSPMAFLQQPLRWLRAITKYRVTHTGGPNFAYDLCVRKASDEDRATLDLSSWECAYNGAEPVRPATLDRFADTFAPCGFRRTSFFPCYGLAEATLAVSGGFVGEHAAAGARLVAADLERNRAVDATDTDGSAREVASCGSLMAGASVAIVDPATAGRLGDSEVGEIWVKGAIVARGYWNRPDDADHTFDARIGEDGPYLRTGDLGFMRAGALYVTGRCKDLIIIRGRNLYPSDIEATIERTHRRIRPGCSAAFAVDVQGEERLVVVLELERRQLVDRRAMGAGQASGERRAGPDRRQSPDPGFEPDAGSLDMDELKKLLRRVVAESFDLQLHDIVPVEAGTVPKTSSGKIQRRASRAAYVAGALQRTDRPAGAST
jgi:acyl-CoA synthetase (AMP-forming)/AMP-acid ligase II